jgi:hypothetical protein
MAGGQQKKKNEKEKKKLGWWWGSWVTRADVTGFQLRAPPRTLCESVLQGTCILDWPKPVGRQHSWPLRADVMGPEFKACGGDHY